MRSAVLALTGIAAALLAASPAQADEIFGGVYVHDVDTPLTISGVEGGADISSAGAANRSTKLRLQPYVFVAVNTAGETNYAAVGLSRKFGDKVYHPSGRRHRGPHRLGRQLRRPHQRQGRFRKPRPVRARARRSAREINDRMTLEASWVHMSHGSLFGKQNPGIDNFGVRLSVKI